jgi:adenylyl- and sulfurtransferase ThiI
MFSPNCVIALPAPEISLKSSAVRGFMLKKLEKNMVLYLKHFSAEHGNFVSLAGRIVILY